jgi:Divergent InlB B-repeat domain
MLTAVPATGSAFVGWSGDCSGTDLRCTVVLETTRMVTAHFDFAPSTSIVGVYNINPSFSYSCLGGSVTFQVSAFEFLSQVPLFLRGVPSLPDLDPNHLGGSLILSGPATAAGADFTTQAVTPGDATLTYTLTGTFRADGRTWDGVFTFACSGTLCDGGNFLPPPPCTNQSFAITGTRQ